MRARFAICVAAAILSVAVVTAASSSRVKGYRAVIFRGPTLKEPIRVSDFEQASNLYIALLRGTTPIAPDSVNLADATCLHVAAFVARPESEHIPVEQLPDSGDFNLRMYLFRPGVMPVLTFGEGRAVRISSYAAGQLATLRVPVSVETPEAASCR